MAPPIQFTETLPYIRGWPTIRIGFFPTWNHGPQSRGQDSVHGELLLGSVVFPSLPQGSGFIIPRMVGFTLRVKAPISMTFGCGRKPWGGHGRTERLIHTCIVPPLETGCIFGAITQYKGVVIFTIFQQVPCS